MESNHIVMDVLRHVDGLVWSLQTSLITRRHQTPQLLKNKIGSLNYHPHKQRHKEGTVIFFF